MAFDVKQRQIMKFGVRIRDLDLAQIREIAYPTYYM